MADKIELVGSEEFKKKVQASLDLLKEKAKEDYDYILKNKVRVIRSYVRSGISLNEHPRAINIAPPTLNASKAWLTSVFVHDTTHAYLKDKGEPHTGKSAEIICNNRQMETLLKIGADKDTINWLKHQTGDHFDLNGNGVYDKEDVKLRNW